MAAEDVARKSLTENEERALLAEMTEGDPIAQEMVVHRNSPDALIIWAGKHFCSLEKDIGKLFDGTSKIKNDDRRNEFVEGFRCVQEPTIDTMTKTPAKTIAGMRSKAEALIAFAPDILEPRTGSWDELLLISLLNDLIRGDA
jgi:hypothetical protein